ncbi:hypothetical protein VOI54_10745 [Tamlana sp. 2201CG12-4]|uniref:hypothetical protein n=1 Tax=Tamlana sp. 2201CG12-4 TaxID=3112582 RepID=UPI002DBEB0B7|nr:hypothetical protein [Tamlana sp. 2201CG12-4]MEC3907498.1 hypothetical protein [Tamlana sp. 2201CG12-4]
MKKLIVLFLFFPALYFGQQGINYKAVIYDDGTVIQNQQITLYFTIIEEAITNVYAETHVLTTDENGLIVTDIGEGTTTLGDFETIDWTKEQYLKVQINKGNGIENLGTTAFKHVPYALHAKTASTITGTIPNVGNLVKVIENGNTGYRLIDSPAPHHGDIGANAIDLSNQSYESETSGATGESAFAAGDNTKATGVASVALGQITEAVDFGVAMGYGSKALDNYATAIGYNNIANGRYSTSIGGSNYSAADHSTTLGWGTSARSNSEIAIGRYNTVYVPGLSSGWDLNDRLFVIGNGSSAGNESDALIIKKSGNTEINGSLTIDTANDDTGYTLPATKGEQGQVLAMNAGNSGTHWKAAGHLVKVKDDVNGHMGYRLSNINYAAYGTIGANAVDLSVQTTSPSNKGATGEGAFASGINTVASGRMSAVMGNNTEASGRFALASGYYATASGDVTFAMGDYAEASGSHAIAMGRDNVASGGESMAIGGSGNLASGRSSVAIGLNNVASGIHAVALGVGNIANADHQISIGKFCTDDTGSPRRLFVIGNGFDPTLRKDALVVLETGDTTVNGDTTINGDLETDEIHAEDSGDADMKAYIYGMVSSSGVKSVASSGGFIVQKMALGVYRITFNNPPPSHVSYMVMASLNNLGFVKTDRAQNYITISTYNASGILSDKEFNFVVYKK